MFSRFVVGQRHEDSGLTWFEENLDTPEHFNRSTSKGYDRRRTRGISWLKDSAVEHLAEMHVLKAFVEGAGHPVAIVRENRVGYVVWEDEHQVVAEPFNDTRTG